MPHTKYIWDPLSDNVLMEKDESGDTKATNTYLPEQYGDLISQRRDGETRFYHFDGQGSTRALTDQDEDVTDTYTYTAFGEEVSRSGTTANPYRYVGEKGYYFDEEIDEYYVRARTYVPTIARWLSVDPLSFMDGTNFYVYVLNDPVNKADSSGLATYCPKYIPWVDTGGGDKVGCCKVSPMTFVVVPRKSKCQLAEIGDEPTLGYIAVFEAAAQFVNDATSSCRACQYRQYIKGFMRFRIVGDRKWVYPKTGDGQEFNFPVFREDDTAPGSWGYGHRWGPERDTEEYSEPDRKTGCRYTMIDYPGMHDIGRVVADAHRGGLQVEFEINFDFKLMIKDMYCEPRNKGEINYPVKWKIILPEKRGRDPGSPPPVP